MARTAPVIGLWELRFEDMPPRGARLVARCWRCKRRGEIPVADMIARYGPNEFVKRLPDARCTVCGARTGIEVEWPDPPYYRPE